ncbi:hypothetical protein C0Q70_11294 [Pomacea canaliculata]|uniref:Uncharacterized protein n=1 Tax=Pomacea canaliculata TaxID=400727 RepID=A0A2T7P5L0_POMCA|nr:hypothetical protein C0Q70_11294 [Pomacea canaliculata]
MTIMGRHPFIGLVSRPLREEFGMKAQSYTAGVVYGLHATSDVISTIIAVDRCLCVVCPLRVAHLIRTRTMVAVMATSFVFLQLSYAMLPIKFTVASVYTLFTPCVNFLIDLWDPLAGDEFVYTSMAYTLGVVYGLRATSDIISMIIAVDRCLCVLLPLRVTHLIRTRTMAAMMAASFFFLQLCYIVLPLRFTVARKTKSPVYPTRSLTTALSSKQ